MMKAPNHKLFNIKLVLIATVLCVANVLWLHYANKTDQMINDRWLLSVYPMIENIYSDPSKWINLFLPIPEADNLWKPTSFIFIDLAQKFLPTPSVIYYLCNALLMVVAFFVSWEIFHSVIFSITFTFCLGFGTQFIVIYQWPIYISSLLLCVYYLTYMYCCYSYLVSNERQIIRFCGCLISALFMALAHDAWTDCYAGTIFISIYLVILFKKQKDTIKFRKTIYLASAITAVFMIFMVVKATYPVAVSDPNNRAHSGLGGESDIVLRNYPLVFIIIDEIIGKYLTLFYTAISNFLPPFFIGSNSLFVHGPGALVDMQHGYHSDRTYLVVMQQLFQWRFYAGILFAIMSAFFIKSLRQSLLRPDVFNVALSIILIMIFTTSPARLLIKARPLMSVPLYGTWVLFSIVGASALIGLAALYAKGKIKKKRYSLLVVAIYLSLILRMLLFPAYQRHLHAVVYVPYTNVSYNDPLVNLTNSRE